MTPDDPRVGTSFPVRIAVAQPRMFWSGAENTDESIDIARRAAMRGAAICVFPELSVTGYHRQIRTEAARRRSLRRSPA